MFPIIRIALAFRHPPATQGMVDISYPSTNILAVFLGIWWNLPPAPLNQVWLYGLLRPDEHSGNDVCSCQWKLEAPPCLLLMSRWYPDQSDPWDYYGQGLSLTFCGHMVWVLINHCCFKLTRFGGFYPQIIHFLWDDYPQFQNLILKLVIPMNSSAENVSLGIPWWSDYDSVFSLPGPGFDSLVRELESRKLPRNSQKQKKSLGGWCAF